MNSALKAKILEELDRMTPEEQERAARSVQALGSGKAPPRKTLEQLLPDLDVLDSQSAREMREAIEAEFEQVDPRGW